MPLFDHAGFEKLTIMPTLDKITIDPPDDGVVVDPITWFDSPGPLEIEIGAGKGGLLLSRARSHPDSRLLGIEWANKYYKYAADRMARWGITNVRVMRTDASHFVIHHLAAACVDVMHVYHPDPWPKKRHHKRRLFQPAFAPAVARVLRPGGELLVQSDHEEYFAWIREVIANEHALREIDWTSANSKPGDDWSGTNFEIKYAREGRAIYRAAYVRD
jgi:tRNA (guanine-N7-)-methyltransferase